MKTKCRLAVGVFSCEFNGEDVVLKVGRNGRRVASDIKYEVKVLEFLQYKKISGIPHLIASGCHSVFGNGLIIKPFGEVLEKYGKNS
jgi:predicted Ser/Thr protein kinase